MQDFALIWKWSQCKKC